MSILLKTHSLNHPDCCIMCMETLLNILKYNTIFKDVYREVGLLEIFVTCLTRYATMLQDKNSTISSGKDYKIPHGQLKLGSLVIEALTVLLMSNSPNANVLRECGGAKCVHKLVQFPECRSHALGKFFLYFSYLKLISMKDVKSRYLPLLYKDECG